MTKAQFIYDWKEKTVKMNGKMYFLNPIPTEHLRILVHYKRRIKERAVSLADLKGPWWWYI